MTTPTMPWGTYAGRPLRELPDSYLRGLTQPNHGPGRRDPDHQALLAALEAERERRLRNP